jgi:hypothetical protein
MFGAGMKDWTLHHIAVSKVQHVWVVDAPAVAAAAAAGCR